MTIQELTYLLPSYKMILFIVVIGFIHGIPSVSSASAPINTPIVNTTYGPVQGTLIPLPTNKTVKRYLGIPFAKAARLEYPTPPDKWTTTLHANITDKICPQPAAMLNPTAVQTEDCLQLNVFVPVNASSGLLPVMLWIHGGAYVLGDTVVYDGSVLATEGEVIVVVAAYRLGALGFLSSDSDDLRGNYGMMDQIEAMKWVNKNIERFGGDPNRVTIFGESAGGMSVSLLMLSPLTSGLYQHVIIQSGSAVSLFSFLEKSEADVRARSFAKALGCDDMTALKACVKEKTVQEILTAQLQVIQEPNFAPFAPVVDGYFLPDSPTKLLKEGKFNKSNVMIGVTRNDGSVFLEALPGIMKGLNVSNGLSRASFQEVINQRVWIRNQTAQIPETLIYEYTDWSRVSDVNVTRQRFIDINTDANFKAPAVLSAKAFVKKQSATYFYQLEKAPKTFPGFAAEVPSWLGVFHGADLIYTFGLPLVTPRNMTTPGNIQLSKDIMNFWTNFAKSGNPNDPSPLATSWPQYTADKEEYLGLGQNLTVRSKLLPDRMAFWNEFLPALSELSKPNATVNTPSEKPTDLDNGDEDHKKNKLVTVLAILAGVFGALAVILLVVLIVTCCNKKRGGKYEQAVNMQ